MDYKFLVEEEILGKEMEIGMLGNHPAIISDPAEVIKDGSVYTYEGKYSTSRSMPARIKTPLSEEVRKAGRRAAETIYKAVGCPGMARIDFFLTPENQWVLNEVNPIPGLTPTSVYPKLWPAEGISLQTVVDRIIIAALYRKRYYDRCLKLKS
jgi:D-alanine-D-alanine ligase